MFELVQTRSGAWGLRSRRFQEVCHPGAGPAAEARALYVEGLNLPKRLSECRTEVVVWDIGLGGAANAMAAIHAARDFACRLHVVSFDVSMDPLAFALHHAEPLGYFGEFLPYARRVGVDRSIEVPWGRARIVWEVVLGDFTEWVRGSESASMPSPEAVFFDPHSPGANPEMWTLPLFEALRHRLEGSRSAVMATYSRSTAPRVAMLLAGFCVGAGRATGFKEETTVAATSVGLLENPLGARWLERARRSHAAEPWTVPPYQDQPLGDARWEQLRDHPQFREWVRR
jgi:tRNA U34 5-methylaminomethyl-2-thiouridine-forming methyltransferase MnmC